MVLATTLVQADHVHHVPLARTLVLLLLLLVLHVPLARTLPLVKYPVQTVQRDMHAQYKGPPTQIRTTTSVQREHMRLPAPHPV